jgi:hypothetical protein
MTFSKYGFKYLATKELQIISTFWAVDTSLLYEKIWMLVSIFTARMGVFKSYHSDIHPSKLSKRRVW